MRAFILSQFARLRFTHRAAALRFAQCRNGGVAVTFGLSLLPVGILVGAGVDYARLTTAQTNLQSAVDSAVLSGVTAAAGSQTAVAGKVLTGALGENAPLLTSQLFTTNADGSLDGTATLTVPLTFMKLAQMSSRTVSARAKATPSSGSTTVGNNVCILLKDRSASQSLLVNSGVTINAPNCEIDVASTGSPAAMINNGAGITVAKLCVAGSNVTTNGSAPGNLSKSCTTASDPFAGTLPTVGATSCTVSNQNYSGTVSLVPGVYCGNFNFNGRGTLNLAAGLYVLKGTRWNLNSGWTVNGNGVTLYYADANSYIQVNSGVAINIAAPTSGTYANILMYEPTGLSTSSFSINGSAGHTFTGLIYLPSRNVTFNSVSNVTSESITMVFNQMILDQINWKFTAGAKVIPSAGSATSTTASSGVRLVN